MGARFGASVVAGLLLLAPGCAARRHGTEAADLSRALEARAGLTLRPEDRAPGELPDGVDLGDGLSPEEAAAIALWNNPELEVALTSLGSSRADLITAGRVANPTVSGLIPLGPRQWQAAVSLPVDGLWLRPLRVAEARARNDATTQRVLQSALDLVADSKLAVLQASAATARHEVLTTLERTEEARRERVQLLVDVGDASPQLQDDAFTRRLDASRRRRASERDEIGVEVDLARLTGLPDVATLAPSPLVELVPDAPAPEPGPLVAAALAHRPEVEAARQELDAAEAALRLAHASVVPAALGVHVQGGGTSSNKGAGLTPSLTVPLLDWNQSGIAAAQARIATAEARYRALEARLGFDLEAAVAELRDASEALHQLDGELAPAQARALSRAELARQVGDASELDVLVARAQALQLELDTIDARVRVGAAWIALERAVGTTALRPEETP